MASFALCKDVKWGHATIITGQMGNPQDTSLYNVLWVTRRKVLLLFLDGRIPISNNGAENAIRPFVIGRKNWLFCKSDDGARAAANAFRVIETAKANGLDVLKYLILLFQNLPMTDGQTTDDFIEYLMPWNDDVRSACQRGCI